MYAAATITVIFALAAVIVLVLLGVLFPDLSNEPRHEGTDENETQGGRRRRRL